MNTAVRGARRKAVAARGKRKSPRDVDASVDITDSTDTGSITTSEKNYSETPANDVKEVCEGITCRLWNNNVYCINNKKAVLPQGNRAMLQLFFSV